MPPMTGRVIAGRYNLQNPIGRGAMGVVWRARDQLLDRDVAVKEVTISALISADERHNAYQRTLREARTAARLSHRGVVAVYDVAEEDGRPWIIMELVPSQSLDQVLTVDGRLSPLRAGRIGQQLLSALAHAHAAGVLHRDVKPSNVLIAKDRVGSGWDERAVLTDFGIAQFEGDPRLTQTGMVMGSPGFTAPERIRGGDATPASDLWSLGATLWAAVEGRGPYEQRGGAITTMSAIINEDAPVAAHAGRLAPLIAALMRREPRDRPSATAVAVMFSQILPQLAGNDSARAASHPPTLHSKLPRPAGSAPANPAASAAASDPVADVPAPAPERGPSAQPAPTTADDPEPALARAAAIASRSPDEASTAAASADAVDSHADGTGSADADADNSAAANAGAQPADNRPADAAAADADADVASAEVASAADDRADDEVTEPYPVTRRAGEADDAAAAGDAAETYPAAAHADDPAADVAERELAASAADDEAAGDSAAAAGVAGIAVGAVAAAGLGVAETLDGAEGGSEPVTFVGPASAVVPSPAGSDPKPDGGSARYRPTDPSIPALRSEVAEAPASAALKPIPTFTAAKPGERNVPTFSAARPGTPASPATPAKPSAPPGSAGHHPAQAGSGWSQSGAKQSGWSQSGRPQSGWSQSGSQQPGWPPPSRNGAGQAPPGGTTPLPQGSASYAGPSQDHSDLAAEYPPGSGGGRAARSGKRGRGRLAAVVIGAIVAAAAVGVGTAYALEHHGSSTNNLNRASNNSATYPRGFVAAPTVQALDHPSSIVPTGWTPYTVTAAQAGAKAAGFSIDLPPGWSESPAGPSHPHATEFFGPGDEFIDVDLTNHTYPNMLTEGRFLEKSSLPTHPGYQRLRLDREPVLGTDGAFWKFTYDNAAGVELQVNDILFIEPTSAGAQSYAIEFRTRDTTWNATVPRWEKILRTFKTVPASTT